MKVIVGLGNPGKKYAGTRHNIGFDVLAELAWRFKAPAPRVRFEAELADIQIGSERVWLLAPQTYMNASGKSVGQMAAFYQLLPDQILVVLDDLALPIGKLRLRASGSAGGQKGLANILQALGTQAVPRLRIGIEAPPGEMAAADYVLSRFHKSEEETVSASVRRAADAAETWVNEGLAVAMNRFNVEADK